MTTTIVLQRCLKCGGELGQANGRIECLSCGSSWPVINDVPVYASAKYFGEVSRDEIGRLVVAAETGYWLEAVKRHFWDSNPDMYYYIADLTRAAWIPLLPLSPDSTVLDVGAGLGAITHALALNYHHVVAVEPIEERVAFTKIRARQEHLDNVELIQTTVTELPFLENTFDLIVLNGILEWVGEWRRDLDPRDAQIQTLRDLRRLLKPGGIILIGIENRIGLGSFLSRVDHSGLPYTSLMPRAVASAYLRFRRPAFHRASIDSTQGYRTYTYSPRGYLKLLRKAGFDSADFWWPPDGYNAPHGMLRLSDLREVTSHYRRDRDYKNRVNGPTLRRQLKALVVPGTAGRASLFADDLVIMAGGRDASARTHPDTVESLSEALNRHAAGIGITLGTAHHDQNVCHAATLTGHRLRNKSVLTLVTTDGALKAVAKVTNRALPGATAIERAFTFLQALHSAWQPLDKPLKGSAPVPITLLRVGPLIASLETPAPGMRLQDLSMGRSYFADRQKVERHLDLIVSWLILAQSALGALAAEGVIDQIPSHWRRTLESSEESMVTRRRHISWSQHGDFFSENVFIDEAAQGLFVIDWDGVGHGYPPLFDWFCLVTSLYYVRHTPTLPKGQTIDALSFRQTYFERGWFSDLVVRLTCRISDECGLDREQIAEWFQEYVAVRCCQFQASPSPEDKVWVARYREFYEWIFGHKAECIFDSHRLAAANAPR